MTPDQKIAMASRRFNVAAHALAASVDVADRLANDPDFAADRSAWADARRAEMRIEDLRRYREAESALSAAYREGECDHCYVPLAKCRNDRGRVCCEDCTHPRSAELASEVEYRHEDACRCGVVGPADLPCQDHTDRSTT